MLLYHDVFYTPESHQKPGVRKCYSDGEDLRREPRDFWGSLGAHSDREQHREVVRREESLGEARRSGAGSCSNSRRKEVEKQKGFARLSKGKR